MKSLANIFGFSFLMIYALSSLSSAFVCSDYPDKDLILLDYESEINITSNKYISGSDLPDNWAMLSRGELSERDVETYVREKKEEFQTFNYDTYGLYDAGNLLGVYIQRMKGNKEVLVVIESFSTRSIAEAVYKGYEKVYHKASNIVGFHISYDYGLVGFDGTYSDDNEQIIVFIDSSNRIISVIGKDSRDVRYITEKYSNLSKALLTYETNYLRAMVCKSKTSACTQTFYFSPTNDKYEVLGCSTEHLGITTPCPEKRMETYSNKLEIPFPSCDKGDVIELTYLRISEFPIKNRFWSTRDFYFDSTYPAQKIKLTLTVPKGMDIKNFSTPDVELKINKTNDYTKFSWEKYNVEPYEAENLMPPERDVRPRAGYSSLKSWDEVKKWYEELFNSSIDKKKVAGKVKEIVNDGDSENEKIKKIYEWVRDEIRYEDNEIGFLTGYKPHDPNEILNFKFGDCKDKTALLISMLNAIGVNAYPVLVSEGAINMGVPSPNEFYHAMVMIPRGNNNLWIDPTCDYCPYGYIPPDDQGADVLVLSHPYLGFAKLPINEKDSNYVSDINYTVNLSPDGTADIGITVIKTGSIAISLKKELKDVKEDEVKDIIGYIVKDVCSDFELISHNLLDLGDDETIMLKLTAKCKHFATKSEDKLVYNMVEESFYSTTIDYTERRFPIEIRGNSNYSSLRRIHVPEGYRLDLIPANYSKQESFASYDFGCTAGEDVIICSDKFVEDEIKLLPSEFESFKNFYKNINSLKRSIIFSPKESRSNNVSSPSTTLAASSGTDKTIKQDTPNESGGVTPTLIMAGIALIAIIIVAGIILLRKKR